MIKQNIQIEQIWIELGEKDSQCQAGMNNNSFSGRWCGCDFEHCANGL